MPEPDAAEPPYAKPTVFLSYASEDREAARLIGAALPDFGLEVWLDESGLGGGEAWDQKIRRQIRECDYFMPMVSARTESRLEGYFRREWRLAVERTLDMADDHLFLLPVLLDDTDQSKARVPEKFLAVQWVKVPGGQPNRALELLCRRLTAGKLEDPRPGKVEPRQRDHAPAAALPLEFPREEPGQKAKFWADVAAWMLRSVWALFSRLPRWVRIIIYIWIVAAGFSMLNRSDDKNSGSAEVSPAKVDKLKTISERYNGSLNKSDVVRLGSQIAKEFADDDEPDAGSAAAGPLLAIPFSAMPGDGAAAKFADSSFAMAYGMISISHHGQVSLAKDALSCADLTAALARAKASHATYILCGNVAAVDGAPVLTVKIASAADGSLAWTKSYAAADADPSKIAAEVDTKIPTLPQKQSD